MLIDELKTRKAYLEKVMAITEANLSKRVSGKIRADKRNNVIRYYYRDGRASVNGRYLPEDKVDIARHIVQQDYDEKIRKLAESELKLINRLISLETPDAFVREYEKLGEYRKPLVKPYKNALQKIEIYRANGYYIGKNLIAFFEGGDYIINEKVVRETLEMFLT